MHIYSNQHLRCNFFFQPLYLLPRSNPPIFPPRSTTAPDLLRRFLPLHPPLLSPPPNRHCPHLPSSPGTSQPRENGGPEPRKWSDQRRSRRPLLFRVVPDGFKWRRGCARGRRRSGSRASPSRFPPLRGVRAPQILQLRSWSPCWSCRPGAAFELADMGGRRLEMSPAPASASVEHLLRAPLHDLRHRPIDGGGRGPAKEIRKKSNSNGCAQDEQ